MTEFVNISINFNMYKIVPSPVFANRVKASRMDFGTSVAMTTLSRFRFFMVIFKSRMPSFGELLKCFCINNRIILYGSG